VCSHVDARTHNATEEGEEGVHFEARWWGLYDDACGFEQIRFTF
jgi:hypothetical protein